MLHKFSREHRGFKGAADGRFPVLCNTFYRVSNLLRWDLVFQIYFYVFILYFCSSEGISCHSEKNILSVFDGNILACMNKIWFWWRRF